MMRRTAAVAAEERDQRPRDAHRDGVGAGNLVRKATKTLSLDPDVSVPEDAGGLRDEEAGKRPRADERRGAPVCARARPRFGPDHQADSHPPERVAPVLGWNTPPSRARTTRAYLVPHRGDQAAANAGHLSNKIVTLNPLGSVASKARLPQSVS